MVDYGCSGGNPCPPHWSCLPNGDCYQHPYCVDHQCCYVDRNCDMTTACDADHPCLGAHTFCDPSQGVCCHTCTNCESCPPGLICHNGDCVDPGTVACVTDSDCSCESRGVLCDPVGGFCYYPSGCENGDDCPPGTSCWHGNCTSPNDITCASNDDCADADPPWLCILPDGHCDFA